MNQAKKIFTLMVLASLYACGGGSDGEVQTATVTRSFAMGFTPWPFDATASAINFVYSEIDAQGDIVAHHLDGGIPWQEALDEITYPAAVDNEINARVANTPPGHLVYVTVSPLNGTRDGLAEYWSNAGTGQALPAPWDSRDFDSAEVIQAYINFSKTVIDRLDPDYFNLALEVSELAINDSARFDKFVVFAEQVSISIKAEYPNLKLMLSVAMKSPSSTAAATINTQIPRLTNFIDVIGISTYPYVFFDHADKGDPNNLPTDWLSQIQTIAGGKPLAITETGWIAERLQIPAFSVDVAADAADQARYLEMLFAESESLGMEFIIWFAVVDYDALWNGVLGQDDVSRIWRDIGLYDEGLNARSALTTWQAQLAVPLK